MKSFLLGVYIGLDIVGLAIAIFGLIVLIYSSAKNNIRLTFVKEGTDKAILKYGRFHRSVMYYGGHELDTEWSVRNIENEVDVDGNIIFQQDITDSQGNIIHHQGEVIKGKTGKPLRIRKRPWFLFGGLRWLGIPFIHSIYRHKFKWASFEQVGEDGNLVQKVIPHEDEIDFILVQDDVYYSFVREAETKGMVPVTVEMLLTIRIVNPYRALFRVQDWLEATQNQIKSALRDFVATKTFEELVAQRESAAVRQEDIEKEFNNFLKVSQIDEFLEENYGVRLRKAGLVNIDAAGDRGESYVAAATKKWEAEREKERIETIAAAEVERLDKVYTKIQSYGENGLFIRATEAIAEVGKGPSNLVVFPFGSVQSMLEGWLGRKEKGGV